MKSGNVDGVGQKWIKFASGSDPYGFVRDGQWHVVEIPMADITNCVDLSEVSQLFELLGTTGAIGSIQIDDICFINGGSPISGGNVNPTISITSPSEGQIFNPGDNITITADAADSDGTVSKVEFYQGYNLLGQDLTAPYSSYGTMLQQYISYHCQVTDNSDATRNATVRIYVGSPVLTSIQYREYGNS
jgi:hypothetical protein